ncbi:MAG: NUDIX domain-containing protein [Patescibacteria group bacterium UBA2163]
MTDVVYVNKDDEVIGGGSISDGVMQGVVFRASRVLLINEHGEALLQQRSSDMLLYPSRWNESATGHVDVGEEYIDAAARELQEEISVSDIILTELGTFFAEEIAPEGLPRYSFNRLYVGVYPETMLPSVDPKEVAQVRWVPFDELATWINEKPEDFPQRQCKA